MKPLTDLEPIGKALISWFRSQDLDLADAIMVMSTMLYFQLTMIPKPEREIILESVISAIRHASKA